MVWWRRIHTTDTIHDGFLLRQRFAYMNGLVTLPLLHFSTPLRHTALISNNDFIPSRVACCMLVPPVVASLHPLIVGVTHHLTRQ